MLQPDTAVEILIDDYGLDAVVDTLMEMVATASSEDLPKLQELLETAIAVTGGMH